MFHFQYLLDISSNSYNYDTILFCLWLPESNMVCMYILLILKLSDQCLDSSVRIVFPILLQKFNLTNASFVAVILSYKVVLTVFYINFCSICSSVLFFNVDLILLVRCPIAFLLLQLMGFCFSPLQQSQTEKLAKVYQPKRALLSTKCTISIANLLAARQDLSKIMRTSSGSIREKTACAINKVPLMTNGLFCYEYLSNLNVIINPTFLAL